MLNEQYWALTLRRQEIDKQTKNKLSEASANMNKEQQNYGLGNNMQHIWSVEPISEIRSW